MKTYTQEQLAEILKKHTALLNKKEGGERADLSFANLSRADLRSANLREANLSYNVFFGGSCGAPVYQACRGFGSRQATLTLLALGEPDEWWFFTGCFKGTRSELEESVLEKHGDSASAKNYLRAIQYLVDTAIANR